MNRYQKNFRALGSEVFLTLVSDKSKNYIENLFDQLINQIDDFENRFSRFKTDSELTSFNNLAGKETTVSLPFIKLLIASKFMSEETEGLYNPFILPALQSAGYKGSWPSPEIYNVKTDYSSRELVKFNELVIGNDWAKIPIKSAIEFGGIGKGYLLDELAEKLNDFELEGYWISLGGDIICNGFDLDKKVWQIYVQDAIDSNKNIKIISNNSGKKLAIATSGVTKRKGSLKGKDWNHIIDPRTGKSVENTILTVTVTAETAIAADVYAKCIVIANKDFAVKSKKNDKILDFIIQTKLNHNNINP